jgi:MraZ protein
VLFTGEYEHTIDAKQRLAIPAEIRDALDSTIHGEALYLVLGANGALWLWPERTFEQMAAALDQSLLPADDMMEFEELLFSQASRLEIDKAGRVRLPERMIATAGLRTNVTILGVKDHLELRDSEQWAALRQQKFAKQQDIMLRARRALGEKVNNVGGKKAGP